ncbi:TlpA family protein disulfide reductase [Albibacterium indicum]|uniref:TlpA family protein disulfide reductase n=1 Tax=Albibacterium indicum TaxID=2292082 RepID=UPI0013003718|nr:redoxin domain-containing protein [Pedobacter indicus]
MKRTLLIFSLIILIGSACSNSKPANVPEMVPEFTFFNIVDNQPITRTSLAIEGNVVFLFFDTGCIHCRNEIAMMGENFDQFKNATFYMVSQQDKAIVADFMNTYGKGLQGKPNVHVLLDNRYEFLAKFQPVQYPALYVYGPDRKLKSYLDGENGLDKILAAVNQ